MVSRPDNFKHSVPVPRIYKIASKVAKTVKEGNDSLKNLVYQQKHVNIKTVYALIVETFKRDELIKDLVEKSQLLVNEPRFDPWLAKILICEMLWGKNKMKGDSKPVQTILRYEDELRELLSKCSDVPQQVLNHNVAKPRYVRVNTLKITMEEAVNNFRDEGWTLVNFLDKSNYEGFLERLSNLGPREFMRDIHVSNLLIFPPKTEFYRHEAYTSKHIILQDKASCLPVYLLGATPGSTVLDMCAAPGMKTTQLAASLNDSGKVFAVELDKNRERILRELVEASGATCVETILKDVTQVTERECPNVEYILVDPSCSGSGITDRLEIEKEDPDIKALRLRKLSGFQKQLLRYALTSFPQAKRVVYSTCSINPEENEHVVRQVLETSTEFKLINARKLLKSWNKLGSESIPRVGDMCIYATPENDRTNGFFIAVFERLGEGEKNPFLNVQLVKMFEKGPRTRDQNGGFENVGNRTGDEGSLKKRKRGKGEVHGVLEGRDKVSESSTRCKDAKSNEMEVNSEKESLNVSTPFATFGDEGFGKKKRKKDKLYEEELEDSTEVIPRKKKKKIFEKPVDEGENLTVIKKVEKCREESVTEILNENDVPAKTKKKKKRKDIESEIEMENTEEIRIETHKIKKCREESVAEISNENDVPAKTKKKKKRKDIESEIEVENAEEILIETDEIEECREESVAEISNENDVPAKTKKKKKRKDIESEIEVENAEEIRLETHEIKKCREESIAEPVNEEDIPTKTKKKKRKKDKRECEDSGV